MIALKNFLVKSKAFLSKEQSRQLDLFQKKFQQQHSSQQPGGPPSVTNNATGQHLLNRQRQILQSLRPYQRFFSASLMAQSMRYSFLYRTLLRLHFEEMQEFARQKFQEESELSNSLAASQAPQQVLPSTRLEGILEVLNDPPAGYKEFCGKVIELTFQHVAETKFNFNFYKYSSHNEDDDSQSVVNSQYLSDDELMPNQVMQQAQNVQRLKQGETLHQLPMMRSEIELSFPDSDYSSYFYQQGSGESSEQYK